jgi:hypothetical protein
MNEAESLQLAILVAISTLVLLFVRIVSERQRITMQTLRNRTTIKGPGITLWIPFICKDWKRHRVSDRGFMLEDGMASFQGVSVRAGTSQTIPPGATVQIADFEGMGDASIFMVVPYGYLSQSAYRAKNR